MFTLVVEVVQYARDMRSRQQETKCFKSYSFNVVCAGKKQSDTVLWPDYILRSIRLCIISTLNQEQKQLRSESSKLQTRTKTPDYLRRGCQASCTPSTPPISKVQYTSKHTARATHPCTLNCGWMDMDKWIENKSSSLQNKFMVSGIGSASIYCPAALSKLRGWTCPS